DADINGNSRLTSPEDVGVYLIRATGHASPGQTTPGVGLGGLAPPSENAALGGLPTPTSDDFADFRKHGPRMRIDDLVDTPVSKKKCTIQSDTNHPNNLKTLWSDW
ncbi:unnamed protein product, partial [Ectocarpus sp. 8 AP-2014]